MGGQQIIDHHSDILREETTLFQADIFTLNQCI